MRVEYSKQSGGKTSQAGELCEVGSLTHQVEQACLPWDKGLEEPWQDVKYVQAQIMGICPAHQGIPPDESQVAKQENE